MFLRLRPANQARGGKQQALTDNAASHGVLPTSSEWPVSGNLPPPIMMQVGSRRFLTI